MKSSAVTPEVIEKAAQGDNGAISTIYRAHVQQIYRYIAYRVGSEEDAEDLTAEVFVRMVRNIAQYQPTGAPFEAWLYRIAANCIADFYRKNKQVTQVELMDNVISDAPHPEQRLLDRQEVDELQSAIRQLQDGEQTILILRFVERKSHHEVAEILGKSISAVKNAQHRALVKLAALLGKDKVRHYLRGHDD
ncbi:MAG: sigma-70 family RNA polymerase sigma factor [Anaerolineaceae bacterium]|nr:MAG: sigma-70 family RNA polymerase sigma factor [Anaerolineaceae bacterium]